MNEYALNAIDAKSNEYDIDYALHQTFVPLIILCSVVQIIDTMAWLKYKITNWYIIMYA